MKYLPSILSLAICVLIHPSCKRDPDPSIALINVIDGNGTIQKRVAVSIYKTDAKTELLDQGRTNDLGEYEQEFDMEGEVAAYSIRYDTTVINGTTSFDVDTFCGEIQVVLEYGKTSEELITLQNCN